MGLPGEKFTRTDVKGLLELPASELNILILIRAWEPKLTQYPLIGIEDDEFATARKLITKQEVRAVTLAKLQLQDDLVMWDIGAGSGSVSIEAANLIPNGKIFALEKNRQYLTFIKENLKKFVARNVKLVRPLRRKGSKNCPIRTGSSSAAPAACWRRSSRRSTERLKPDGMIVLNAVTLDTLTKAVEFLEDHGYTVEVTCVNISKTKGADRIQDVRSA